ncbi:MAG: hypothetical protein M3245_01700 [Actinomycetota bacterium]|nr:hypothetical protein [Actinomycetota bacterium]
MTMAMHETSSTRRPVTAFIAALIASTLAVAVVPAPRAPAATKARNMALVAQIAFPDGTDLELFSRALRAWRDRDGTLIQVAGGEPDAVRHFAMVGAETSGARIIDVTEPERPYPVSQVQGCSVSQGDIQLTPDGATAAIAFQTFGACRTHAGAVVTQGAVLVDLKDVYAPRVVGGAPAAAGAHNTTIHPGGRYLYISTSNQADTEAQVPIYDIADPAAPRLVRVWSAPGNSPHDISFNRSGTRAYMAGISQARIVDTSDPENPVLLSTVIPPGGTIGHDAIASADGTYLFLGDEAAGGNAYPCPGGAVYVYDVRDEAEPELLGAAWAGTGPVTVRNEDEPMFPPDWRNAGCTAHVMSLDPGGRSLTVGWYSAGLRTFSFDGLYGPGGAPQPGPVLTWGTRGDRVVETGYLMPDNTRTWAAKRYGPLPGYIFAGDHNLGFYVGKVTGSG